MVQIPIHIPGLEKRRRSIGLLHIVAGFFLLANAGSAYRLLGLQNWAVLVPLFAIALGSIVYGFARKKLDPASRYNFVVRLVQALTFLALALAFSQAGAGNKSLGLYMWVAIAAMLAFTEKIALQEPVIILQQQGLDFPNGFSRKNISWSAVADITLRSDFLTIHYPDNRFLQFELKQPLSGPEAQNVQDFCRRHLDQTSATGQANQL